MADLQNFAKEIESIDVALKDKQNEIVAEVKTDWRWKYWIDYRALNGTIIDYDEETGSETVRKMSMRELAGKLGVTTTTLYDWEKLIPNFWEQVDKRMEELSGQRRISLMRDKFYIHAMTWKNPMVSLKWLEQYDKQWKDPRYKVEHEMGNSMADLMKQLYAEKEPEQKTFIEAEAVTSETQQPDNT